MKWIDAKSDSEVSSIIGGASSQSRSPWRFLNFLRSPWNHDVEKMSYGSSPSTNHCSPIHHSRESSPFQSIIVDDDNDDNDDDDNSSGCYISNVRLYLCSVFWFVVLLSLLALILWGASKAYKPKIFVKHIVFHSFNRQAGIDQTGVSTDMLSLNSTVIIYYRNPSTILGIHVSSTPIELYYYQLKIAFGHMKEFYESRKNQREVVTVVLGHQVPLYGGVPVLENIEVPLNLTFTIRSRAHIWGELVKSKFYKSIRCSVTLRGNKLGKPNNLAHSCSYH